MNNQGDKGVNVMQLIMELEGKVRALTDERDTAVHKYWLALTYKGGGFWWGYGVALVSVLVVDLVIRWITK